MDRIPGMHADSTSGRCLRGDTANACRLPRVGTAL